MLSFYRYGSDSTSTVVECFGDSGVFHEHLRTQALNKTELSTAAAQDMAAAGHIGSNEAYETSLLLQNCFLLNIHEKNLSLNIQG